MMMNRRKHPLQDLSLQSPCKAEFVTRFINRACEAKRRSNATGVIAPVEVTQLMNLVTCSAWGYNRDAT